MFIFAFVLCLSVFRKIYIYRGINVRFHKCVNYFLFSQFLCVLFVSSPYVLQCPVPDSIFSDMLGHFVG